MVGSGGWVGGGQGGCERRSEVVVKIQKKKIFFGGWGSGGGPIRVWVGEGVARFGEVGDVGYGNKAM